MHVFTRLRISLLSIQPLFVPFRSSQQYVFAPPPRQNPRPELTDIDLELHIEIWVLLGNYTPGFGNGSGFGGTESALAMAIVAPAEHLDMARALALW